MLQLRRVQRILPGISDQTTRQCRRHRLRSWWRNCGNYIAIYHVCGLAIPCEDRTAAEVKLIRINLRGIHAPIARMPGLKLVDRTDNRLAGELCEGPWLDSLEELCLIVNHFSQLPTALLQCKGKRRS